jgi:hypothetical protein
MPDTDGPHWAQEPPPIVPDYSGACLSRIVPELLGDRGGGPAGSWLPEPATAAPAVVVLVLDGLGWNELQRHADRMPTLISMAGGPIPTVLPATTSAALTSATTGLHPGRHGVTGFRMLVDGQVLNTLRWTVDAGRPPEPAAVQRHAPFLGRPVAAVTKAEFRTSGFTAAHLAGARFVGWQTPAVLVEQVRRLVKEGERFVFAYYPGIDEVAHAHGIRDEFYAGEIQAADELVGRLLETLPPSAALVVTADHGQAHVDEGDWVDLGDLAALVALQAGDARFRSLYAREGARADLLAGARERFGARAWVRSRAEVIEEGWLGPDVTPGLGGRIGDVVLAARDRVAFFDPAVPYERRLRSAHGSPTADEVLVPLLAAVGEGA